MAAPSGLKEDADRVITFNHRNSIISIDHGRSQWLRIALESHADLLRAATAIGGVDGLRLVCCRYIDVCQPRLLNADIFQALAELDADHGTEK